MASTEHGTYFLDDQLWSVRTLGIFLGGKGNKPLSRGAIARLVRSGLLPAPLRIGASRRWRKSAVLAAIAKLEQAQLKVERRRIRSR